MSKLFKLIRLFAGIGILYFLLLLTGCSGHSEVNDPDRNYQQLGTCRETGRCVSPLPPAAPQQERRGVVNPRTGEYLQPSGNGLYSPRTGDYYQPTGNGYYNPKSGEFIPKR